MSGETCIAFTGGGTGGHVYPGLAVIESLRRQWSGRIVWIGSGKEVERAAVEAAGVEFFSVPSGKLRRSLSLRNLADMFRVAAGYVASRRLLKRLKPVLLFSKGGYVSVPPCLAAASLGIPCFTHESDVSPGLATRINARKARRILVSWEATQAFLDEGKRSRSLVTGNPVRSSIAAGNADRGRSWLGFGTGVPILLVLGRQPGRQADQRFGRGDPAGPCGQGSGGPSDRAGERSGASAGRRVQGLRIRALGARGPIRRRRYRTGQGRSGYRMGELGGGQADGPRATGRPGKPRRPDGERALARAGRRSDRPGAARSDAIDVSPNPYSIWPQPRNAVPSWPKPRAPRRRPGAADSIASLIMEALRPETGLTEES